MFMYFMLPLIFCCGCVLPPVVQFIKRNGEFTVMIGLVQVCWLLGGRGGRGAHCVSHEGRLPRSRMLGSGLQTTAIVQQVVLWLASSWVW